MFGISVQRGSSTAVESVWNICSGESSTAVESVWDICSEGVFHSCGECLGHLFRGGLPQLWTVFGISVQRGSSTAVESVWDISSAGVFHSCGECLGYQFRGGLPQLWRVFGISVQRGSSTAVESVWDICSAGVFHSCGECLGRLLSGGLPQLWRVFGISVQRGSSTAVESVWDISSEGVFGISVQKGSSTAVESVCSDRTCADAPILAGDGESRLAGAVGRSLNQTASRRTDEWGRGSGADRRRVRYCDKNCRKIWSSTASSTRTMQGFQHEVWFILDPSVWVRAACLKLAVNKCSCTFWGQTESG